VKVEIPVKLTALAVSIIAVVLVFALTACQMFKGPDEGGPKKFLLPWPDANGDYHLQEVQINTLEDLSRMEGKYGKIRYNQSSDRVAPEAHFMQTASGVYIPKDTTSQQMAGIYGHIEKLSELENSLGFEGILPRPRFVSIESNIVDSKGSRQMDNATYFGKLDVVAIVPNTSRTLPISLNGGIVAHEHFHAIFFHLVLSRLTDEVAGVRQNVHDDYTEQKPDPRQRLEFQQEGGSPVFVDETRRDKTYFSQILLGGLNEGLADFWAWYYTSDGNFLEKSLTYNSLAKRRVVAERNVLPGKKFFFRRASMDPEDFASVAGYELGTRYATFMRSLAEVEGKEAVAKLMASALRSLPEGWDKLFESGQISPNSWLKFVLGTELTEARCCLAQSILSTEFNDAPSINHMCQSFSCSNR
jgi:hypothetical protein